MNFILADVENFIFFQQRKVDKILSKKEILSKEESILIYSHFSDSLHKIANLFRDLEHIKDENVLKDISAISMHVLAWIIFTFPSIELESPLFAENYKIEEKDILDFLAEKLILIEDLSDNIFSLKEESRHIYNSIDKAASLFGFLASVMKKNIIEN